MSTTLLTGIGELTTNAVLGGPVVPRSALPPAPPVLAPARPAAPSAAPPPVPIRGAGPDPRANPRDATADRDGGSGSGRADRGPLIGQRAASIPHPVPIRGAGPDPRTNPGDAAVDRDGGSGSGRAGDRFGTLHDAAVLIEGDRIVWVGAASDAPAADSVIDAGGCAVIPGFVDSHSHIVFAGDRAAEFEARMGGTPYAAGGIRSTVAATRAATDDELRARLRSFRDEMLAQGTTTIEIKSGYGLTVHDEERLTRLAAEVTPEVTFLGAHVVPAEYAGRADEYVDLVVGPMLDACAPHARWIDVFCETGAFSVEQSRRVLAAGIARGLMPRVHASQLGPGDGVRLAVELGAASIDHGTYLTEDDVAALAASDTVLTLLPGVEFSTRQPYPDARRLLDAGVTVALACDTNPGSSFTSSMPFCIAVAVRDMGMTPGEAVWAATAGGAAALRRDDIGVIAPGARADLVLLKAPSRVHLAYRPGVPLVEKVWKDGALVTVGTEDHGALAR